jgi:hypothetical protein
MKSNLAAILLLLACVGLGVAFWKQNRRYADRRQRLDQTINLYSNRVTILQAKVTHEAAENEALSNHLGVVETTLSTTSVRLQKAEAEAKAAAAVAVDERVEAMRILEAQKIESDENSRDLRDMLGRLLSQYAQLSRSQK